jgi:outer membrane protein OmpA-like peptidoglycan-associated protein
MHNTAGQRLALWATLRRALSGTGAAAAHAAQRLPSLGFYTGVYGGYNAVLGDWDLAEDEANDVSPEGSFLAGLRFGLQIRRWIAAEIGVALIPFAYDSPDDLSGVALSWRIDAIVSPLDIPWSPHVLIGAGVYQLASSDLGSDTDWHLQWGLGIRGMLTKFMNLRGEIRHVVADGFPDGLASNLEIQIGVDFWVWNGSAKPVPKDEDKDGIPDTVDQCPGLPGDETAGGCPDRDQDGVSDSTDACPDTPGTINMRGCPDSDGDGLGDDRDKCPGEVGLVEYEGCPPPPPDADSDGTPDAEDRCPTDRGPPHTGGCPDADGDGIVDGEDKCPTEPGVAATNGCMPRAMKRFSGAVRGINFETGSAQIKRASLRLLDAAVRVFKEYPELRVEIAGHTDDEGDDDANMRLSDERADAVRSYLIEKGIGPDRVMAKGYGETLPIADNRTAGGRAKNRRIEFKIMGAY